MYAPFATSNTVDFQPYNCHYNCHPNERCEITLRPTLPPNLIRKAANISPKLSVKFMFSSHRQEKLPHNRHKPRWEDGNILLSSRQSASNLVAQSVSQNG